MVSHFGDFCAFRCAQFAATLSSLRFLPVSEPGLRPAISMLAVIASAVCCSDGFCWRETVLAAPPFSSDLGILMTLK
jgi:hypothetical protein